MAGHVTAVVLAGGQSRRMGQPKALLRLRPDGPTLIEQAVATLASVADDVLVVTNDAERYAFLGCRLVPDEFPGLGALAGIQAGLAAAVGRALVVACDMPFLNPALLRAMVAEPSDVDVLVPRRADGTLETLHALYGPGCLPAMRAQLTAGAGRVVDFFPQVRVRYLDETWLRRHDPDLRSLENLNTPAELSAARQADGA